MNQNFPYPIEEKWMQKALEEAQSAFDIHEVPIGAVIIHNNEVIASAHNQVESAQDASCHAELQCLRAAAAKLGRWRLNDCVLYCTFEPCIMCYGAMVHFRLGGLVFGAPDLRHGALGSLYDLSLRKHPIHQVPFVSGCLKESCKEIVQRFFRLRREENK